MGVPNATLRRILPTIIPVGIVLCVVLAAYLILNKPVKPRTASAIHANNSATSTRGTRKTVNAGLPVRIKIPNIGVDAALEYVGLTSKGDLDAPNDPANAAWYSQGSRPGDSGNAIIDGHFGYKNNRPAVFDNLHTLREGDKIYVEDEEGVAINFVVRELREYSPDENTAGIFLSNDGNAHLNLITCKGSWNETQKAYAARLVVFTDKIVE